jgi:hypothetical protein
VPRARWGTCTTKQVGDAGEMLVAAEMTLAGVPAMTVPDNWPGYDVIAQPREGGTPQRISVKARTFTRSGTNYVIYKPKSVFDWLAIVTLSGEGQSERRIFIVPGTIADDKFRKDGPKAKTQDRFLPVQKIAEIFPEFENNFCLSPLGMSTGVIHLPSLKDDE